MNKKAPHLPALPDHPVYQAGTLIVRTLQQQGHTAYWAGGCVRDLLLNRTPKDIDIATDAEPDQLQVVFPKAQPIGRAFGVMVLTIDKQPFEIATFRQDHGYQDGRHPDAVTFADAEQDALRRDFTINGLFYDPIGQRLLDYVGGQDDLRRGLIRAIGSPTDRFREDHLRLLRAIRFANVLRFQVEPHTWEAIKENAYSLKEISSERIHDELTRILLEAPQPGDGFKLLQESGLLKTILPEIEKMVGQEQPATYHPEGDVFTHTVMMLNAMGFRDPCLAYAVLLHDVGKPPTARLGPGADGEVRIRFDRHDRVGADLAKTILARLRFSNRDIESIVYCVANHMRFKEVQRMRPSTLRRLMGVATFPTELELHRLDCVCSHGKLDNYRFLLEARRKWIEEPVLPAPWISGHDLRDLGMSEGPRLGRWLKKAYDLQLEGAYPTRNELLEHLREKMAP